MGHKEQPTLRPGNGLKQLSCSYERTPFSALFQAVINAERSHGLDAVERRDEWERCCRRRTSLETGTGEQFVSYSLEGGELRKDIGHIRFPGIGFVFPPQPEQLGETLRKTIKDTPGVLVLCRLEPNYLRNR